MKTSAKRLGPRLRAAAWYLAGLSMALLTGCAHGPGAEKREFMRVYTPQVPIFLTGPAAVLLTNTAGFSAYLILRADSAFPNSDSVEGEVLARGSKLFFAPTHTGSEGKKSRAGGFAFIWDLATGSGFVLSDALQAYAPVASGLRVTNLVFSPGDNPPREATAFMNDGGRAVFRVWSSHDRKDPPERIEAAGVPPLGLTISKVRLQPPSADLFAPPDGFSKYPTPEALADEIAARQYNLRRGARGPQSYNIPLEVR